MKSHTLGITKPADSMVEEKLLDYEKLAHLHAAIDAGKSIDDIKEIQRKVYEEVGRSVAKHTQVGNNRYE
ncbi:hypothetical protein [Desulfogranum japonicum]|uniref:hypothetical protein n=1 Tax=Desulfogranum japonicum TaxID=231447 RepID=UPI000428B3E0|nr:hypothetical protein [Desulfogranum japonicum]